MSWEGGWVSGYQVRCFRMFFVECQWFWTCLMLIFFWFFVGVDGFEWFLRLFSASVFRWWWWCKQWKAVLNEFVCLALIIQMQRRNLVMP